MQPEPIYLFMEVTLILALAVLIYAQYALSKKRAVRSDCLKKYNALG